MKIIELSQKLKKTHKIELNAIFNSPLITILKGDVV